MSLRIVGLRGRVVFLGLVVDLEFDSVPRSSALCRRWLPDIFRF